jgi:hypothetical protein
VEPQLIEVLEREEPDEIAPKKRSVRLAKSVGT